MKRLLLLMALLLPVSFLASCIPNPPDGYVWQFQDDFETLDTAKWTSGWFGPVPSGTNRCTKPANSAEDAGWAAPTVSGSYAIFTVDDADCVDQFNTTYPWTGSGMSTRGKYTITATNFWFQAGAVFPCTAGGAYAGWPAIWLNGATEGTWPADGEFDVAESHSGGDLSAHTHLTGVNSGITLDLGCDANLHYVGAKVVLGSSCSGGAQVTIQYYFDSVLKGADSGCVAWAGMYIVLDLTVDTAGNPVADGQNMKVDFVGVAVPA